jgi:simple sugar transport system ATP-binding protein
LGVAGVEGNGQRELAEVLIGLRAPDSGRIFLDGKDITGHSVAENRELGCGFVPEDRHERGLVLNMTLWENAVLGRQRRKDYSGGWGMLAIRKIKEQATRLIKEFDVRARGVGNDASTLSGGNQQKLILARELEGDPRLLLAQQPTRGLDVGAIEFVWKQILAQKEAGRAVLLISAELEEIYALSDRIVTIYEGRITGEYSPKDPQEKVGIGMTGARSSEKAAS